jgi:hypothetical protein
VELRGDACGGVSDVPGSVLERAGAVFEPGAAEFAGRSLLSRVAFAWLLLGDGFAVLAGMR